MMIFQHTWEKVLSGEKIATSRIVKLNDMANALTTGEIFAVIAGTRLVYAVGTDYAVQPGRGQKSVGRIRITSIERYDVRGITQEQAQQEGFSDKWEFLQVWTGMHDKGIELSTPSYPDNDLYQFYSYATKKNTVTYDWFEVQAFISARPAAKYDAWFIRFELVKEG